MKFLIVFLFLIGCATGPKCHDPTNEPCVCSFQDGKDAVCVPLDLIDEVATGCTFTKRGNLWCPEED